MLCGDDEGGDMGGASRKERPGPPHLGLCLRRCLGCRVLGPLESLPETPWFRWMRASCLHLPSPLPLSPSSHTGSKSCCLVQ